MRSTVNIIFSRHHNLELTVDVEPDPDASKAARRWFDDTWERLGCEPLRPSGKVLLLDKMLGVADTLGYHTFDDEPEQAQEYARQAALALERPHITVDLPGMTVGY